MRARNVSVNLNQTGGRRYTFFFFFLSGHCVSGLSIISSGCMLIEKRAGLGMAWPILPVLRASERMKFSEMILSNATQDCKSLEKFQYAIARQF